MNRNWYRVKNSDPHTEKKTPMKQHWYREKDAEENTHTQRNRKQLNGIGIEKKMSKERLTHREKDTQNKTHCGQQSAMAVCCERSSWEMMEKTKEQN